MLPLLVFTADANANAEYYTSHLNLLQQTDYFMASRKQNKGSGYLYNKVFKHTGC